jgi:hypothetical protein
MSEQLMVCKALGAMIRKHGEPTEEEVNFVAHAAMELGLTAEQNEQVQQVLKEGGDYQGFIAEISSRSMRNYLFRRVVAATLIDDKIEEHELATIQQTAKTFDFSEGVVNEYLEWMKEGIAWEKRGAELLARL